MNSELINIDNYRRGRKRSVPSTVQEQEEMAIAYKKGFKAGYGKGAREWLSIGMKRGIIVGAIAVITSCGLISLAKNALPTDFKNDSYESGYTAVISETHRTNDNQGYWYDYYDIAASFDPSTMDFDSFVYGTYDKLGWNKDSRLMCMDELFGCLSRMGLTDHSSFVAYCDSKGFCSVVDGKRVIDVGAFENAIEEYMVALKDLSTAQDEIASFRNGL